MGQGSQIILINQPDALHVRIEAPMKHRVQRVQQILRSTRYNQEYEMEFRQQMQAYELIMERDTASANYIHYLYHYQWNDPLLYHLTINTARMSIWQAVKIIKTLVQRMTGEEDSKKENREAAWFPIASGED